jgi:uncharacterized damage-inducible protein DinB
MNAAQYFDHWYRTWRDLISAVDSLQDEHLSFRPAESYARDVGDILRHIIAMEQGWIHFVIRRKLPAWPESDAAGFSNVTAIKAEMQRVHADTMEYLAGLPIEEFDRIVPTPEDGTAKLQWILWHVLEQQIHHRGELYLCLSMLGIPRPETDHPG